MPASGVVGMSSVYRFVNWSFKGLLHLLCRIDDSQLDRVPPAGPLIAVGNHISFLDAPILLTHLQPRPMTGFAKVETWDNLALRVLFDLWGAIPLRRGEVDRRAFRQAEEALAAGKIFGVAPEGTRSHDGRLRQGHPGVVFLALRTRAPLLPIAYYGGENLRRNLPRLRRTDFRIVVGDPFTLSADGPMNGEVRQQIADEVMYQLAALLPPAYRGYYADLSRASEEHLRFAPGTESNLRRASG